LHRHAWLAVPRSAVTLSLLALVVISFLACAGAAASIWFGSWGLTDRLAALGALFTFGALWVAVIAAVVAVAAYQLASGRPQLKVAVFTPDSQNPNPWLYHPEHGGELASILFTVRLYNVSQFSARNPAVRIELSGLEDVGVEAPFGIVAPFQVKDGWSMTECDPSAGTMTWVWIGGVDATIHGPRWFIDTPLLDLSECRWKPWERATDTTYRFWLEAVAEGAFVRAQYDLQVGEWVSGLDAVIPSD
jgi:hypothetical protein